jgi:hypothetical protein
LFFAVLSIKNDVNPSSLAPFASTSKSSTYKLSAAVTP